MPLAPPLPPRLARVLAIVIVLGAAVASAQTAPDPAVVGRWDARAKWPAVAVHLVLMPTGDVVFWRGDENVPATYVWDPATEAIEQLLPGADIFCAGDSLLPDGRLLVTGGAQPGSHAGADHALIFDPWARRWSPTAGMRAGRFYPTQVALGEGRTAVFSGRDVNGKLNPEVEVFVPFGAAGGADAMQYLPNADHTIEYYPRMQLLPDGRVLHVGEEQTTDVFDPATQAWSVVAQNLFGVRTEGTDVVLPPGRTRILIAGGTGKSGPPTNTAEILDLSAPQPAWRYTSSMHYGREHLQAVTLPDGRILVIGGVDANDDVLPAEIFDPATESWTVVASLASGRGYHSSAVLLPDGRVLEAGANGNASREIYSPPYLFRGPQPVIASVPPDVDYGATFTVETPDAARIATAVFMRLGASTHAANMEQRYVPVAFHPTGDGTLELTAPDQPNVAPPGYYMLFLVDADGVPSKAPFVRLRGTGTPTVTTVTLPGATTTTAAPPPTTTTSTTAPKPSTTTTTTLPATVTVEVREAASGDDAEEQPNLKVVINSKNLQLVHDTADQTIGLRFPKLDVPPGATVLTAWIQLTSDQAQSEPTSLTIRGNAADNAATFSTKKANVTSRPRTTASVAWSDVPPWTLAGETGPAERTPELWPIVQEIVSRAKWKRKNAIAFVIGGTGHRTARAWDADKKHPPLLHVEYILGPRPTTTTTTTTSTTTTAPPDTTTTTLP